MFRQISLDTCLVKIVAKLQLQCESDLRGGGVESLFGMMLRRARTVRADDARDRGAITNGVACNCRGGGKNHSSHLTLIRFTPWIITPN